MYTMWGAGMPGWLIHRLGCPPRGVRIRTSMGSASAPRIHGSEAGVLHYGVWLAVAAQQPPFRG
jgi:hypothetical protein